MSYYFLFSRQPFRRHQPRRYIRPLAVLAALAVTVSKFLFAVVRFGTAAATAVAAAVVGRPRRRRGLTGGDVDRIGVVGRS